MQCLEISVVVSCFSCSCIFVPSLFRLVKHQTQLIVILNNKTNNQNNNQLLYVPYVSAIAE